MAVHNISFSIHPGEIVGYVGKNGAGKSTTIKMLIGVLKPSAGEIRINGYDPYTQRSKISYEIGVVFGQRSQLWRDLPLIESLKLFKEIYGISTDSFNKKLALFDDILSLQEFIDQPVRLLSLGQRIRGDLAAALLHDPNILYLDEPTIGLDIEAKVQIREFIKERKFAFRKLSFILPRS